MKETIKLGIILLLFTAVAGGVLALSNSFTEPIIAERQKEESLGAFFEMFADADDFEDIEESLLEEIQNNNDYVREIYEAKKGDETIGYALKVSSTGYDGEISTAVGINEDGTIAGIENISNTETKGIGTRIEDDEFTDSFIDKSTDSELVAVDSPAEEDEVQLLSGATISTDGALKGINGAREVFVDYLED
ncbi:MAG TPA: RnfABCDGE type electron transport complex subunit G [Tissierellaceae bacterium]|nr:RnfABCDGE type electron transport complex subunit G [Tissierellaceae bacterium]